MTMRRQRSITLLTDFGYQDAYAGIMKGIIAEINPLANIIDICHNVPPQDIFNGAYLLHTAYKYFPKDTIHVAIVDPGVGSKRDIVCMKTKDYFFLVPNNGILSFIVQEEKPKGIFRVTNNKYFLPTTSNTFHGRDIFAPIAAHLSLGVKPQLLGIKISQLTLLDIPKPTSKKTGILEGQIIYIDRFGNLITNIKREHLAQYSLNQTQNKDQWSEDRSQTSDTLKKTSKKKIPLPCNTIETTIGKKKIRGLSKTYTDAKPGEPLVLFGSAGFLEVSVNQGNAQKYFRVNNGNKIIIKNVR
ncbi:MAG: SAM-dependent chlorinase/fluorinase [Planctomycetota bacterium]|nr:SAM-dependent chlorinase/fluorinase [Planctomycetota bacterium]